MSIEINTMRTDAAMAKGLEELDPRIRKQTAVASASSRNRTKMNAGAPASKKRQTSKKQPSNRGKKGLENQNMILVVILRMHALGNSV